MSQENSADRPEWGDRELREARWPASVAVVLAIVLYETLPSRLTVGPAWLLPTLEAALLVPLSFMSPYRHPEETRLGRATSIALIAIISAFNLVALTHLLYDLVQKGISDAHELLFSSVQIWLTNVIIFGLWYWELDRGGPALRRRAHQREPDFLFPQMATPNVAPSGWEPGFVDYLYVAFTNATAFSPTDTLPLTPWAKLLMLVQSLASLLTIALVAARAVNILK